MESIDTGTPQGKFMLTVFGVLYELERDNIKQRQAEGTEIALNFGRPKQAITPVFEKVYKEWKAGQITARGAMRRLDMKPNQWTPIANSLLNHSMLLSLPVPLCSTSAAPQMMKMARILPYAKASARVPSPQASRVFAYTDVLDLDRAHHGAFR